MQGTKPKQEEKKKCKGEGVPGGAEDGGLLAGLKTVACWRGYGGVASGLRLWAVVLRLFDLLSLSLPFSLFRFCFFFLFLFLFSVLVSVFSSLSLLRALSLFGLLSLPLFLQKKIRPPPLSFGLPIYSKKNGVGMLFLVRLQSRLAGRFFRWWWGRGERRGRIFEIFFVFCSVKTGGRRKMNNVVQNDTVLIFLFFFLFYIYI